MSDQHPRTAKQLLAERLRHEAAATRPAFSATLHERIMEAIERSAMAAPGVRTAVVVQPLAQKRTVPFARQHATAWGRRLSSGGRLLLTAACLLLLAAVGWHVRSASQPSAANDANVAANAAVAGADSEDLTTLSDLADSAAQHVNALVESTATNHQSALLKADMLLAADALTESLTFDPAAGDSSQP